MRANRIGFAPKEFFAPTRRNAIKFACIAAGVYAYFLFTEMYLASDLERMKVGVNKNELFNVEAYQKIPVISLWLIGLLPLFAAVYTCHFFLRPTGAGNAKMAIPNNEAAGGIAVAGGHQPPHPLIQALSETRARIGLIVGSVIVSFFLTLRVFSAFAMVCNYPLHEMSELCSFSLDVVDAIRARHGPDSVWIIQGTLIGALRADRSKNSMVLNDHDFDVCYDKRLEPEILETVRSLGVLYERFSRTYAYVDTHLRLYPPKFSVLSGHSGPLLFELQACEPVKTRLITGCNNLPVPIPTNYEEVLTAEYGPDWRIPRSDNHAVLCTLFGGW